MSSQETVCLTREQMAALFASTTGNIRQHVRNIFVDGALEESATTKESFVVRSEGDRRVRRRISALQPRRDLLGRITSRTVEDRVNRYLDVMEDSRQELRSRYYEGLYRPEYLPAADGPPCSATPWMCLMSSAVDWFR